MDNNQNDIMKSQLRFTVTEQTSPLKSNKNSLRATKDLSQEIFRKSINMSSIGKMSGNNAIAQKFEQQGHSLKEIVQIDEGEGEEATQPRVSMVKKRKRIDFSIRNREDNIYQSKIVSEQDSKYLQIVSMTDRQGQNVMQMKGCTICGDDLKPRQCMIQLENESTMLIYRPNQKGQYTQLFFSLNFDTTSAQITRSQQGDQRQIIIESGGCKLILEHQSRTNINKWYELLLQMQKQSKGNEHQLQALVQQNFYNIRYQTESFFSENAQTGDIILFEDSHFFAKAQRFITDSDFDHVAMIIRDTTHGILLFESNSGSGVSLTPWKYVVKFDWYKTIPRIVWRRLLDVNRTTEFNAIVEEFVRQNISKNYHINLDKLMMNTSMLRANSLQGQEPNQEHGYFCSQLVAAIYKDLSLLTRDTKHDNYKPGCNFYPKDFTERTGRQLDKGRLSPEYQIFFDQKELAMRYRFKENK